MVIAFSAFQRSDPLVWSNHLAATREAVDRCPYRRHLIDRRDPIVCVVGRAQPEVDCCPHRAHKVGLLLAAVREVSVGEQIGVLGEEGWNEFVLHVLLQLILAHELRVNDHSAAVLVRGCRLRRIHAPSTPYPPPRRH